MGLRRRIASTLTELRPAQPAGVLARGSIELLVQPDLNAPLRPHPSKWALEPDIEALRTRSFGESRLPANIGGAIESAAINRLGNEGESPRSNPNERVIGMAREITKGICIADE